MSGRYNRTRVVNRDQLNPGGGIDSLDGEHSFQRINPALGLSESSRAPTAIELGCANPDKPCKLTNAMAGDPPLKQVVTRTVEAGLRGQLDRDTAWRLGVFRADNRDDTSASPTNRPASAASGTSAARAARASRPASAPAWVRSPWAQTSPC
jgi:hypothetical protein